MNRAGGTLERDDVFDDAFVDAAAVRERDICSLPRPSRESMREVKREARRRRRAVRPARRKWAVAAAAVVVAVAAGVAVLQLVGRQSGTSASSLAPAAGPKSPTAGAGGPSASPPAGRLALVTYTVGTCRFWDTRPASNVVAYKDHVVPCAQSHNSELVGVHTYSRPSQAYPGSPADYPYFETVCRADVTRWVGPARPSWVKTGYEIPDIPHWEVGDRRFACFVVADPARAGSARNLGRT